MKYMINKEECTYKFNAAAYAKLKVLKLLLYVLLVTILICSVIAVRGLLDVKVFATVFGAGLIIGILLFLNRMRVAAKSQIVVEKGSIYYCEPVRRGFDFFEYVNLEKQYCIKRIDSVTGKKHSLTICGNIDCKTVDEKGNFDLTAVSEVEIPDYFTDFGAFTAYITEMKEE